MKWWRRLWPVGLLLLLGATADETRSFRLAQAAFEDRLFDFAARQLTEFLEKYPQSEYADTASLMLAQAQLRLHDPVGALETLERATRGRPPEQLSDAFLFWRAEALLHAERFADADTAYAQVLERTASPYRPRALLGRALANLKLDRWDAAEKFLDEIPQTTRRARLLNEAQLLRAQLALGRERFEEAEQLLDDLIKRAGESLWAYRAMRWRAELLARQNRGTDALALFRMITDAYRANPGRPVEPVLAAEAWAGQGRVLLDQQQFDEAVAAYRQALDLNPPPALRRDVLLKLGEALVRANRVAEGVAQLRALLAEAPQQRGADDLQLAIADLWYAHQDYAAALSEYQRLLTTYPQSGRVAEAAYRAGWCALKLNRPAEAQTLFQKAAETAGTNWALAAEAWFKLADTQFEAGRFAEAVASYQRVISSYDDSPLVERALLQLALTYQRMQNADASLHTLTVLLEKFPRGEHAPAAWLHIGTIHANSGREADARAAFRQLIEQFPKHSLAASARLALGESFYREGQYEAAAAEYDRLIAEQPDSPLGQRAFYNRGWCWWALGRAEQTLQEFRDFLSRYPQSPLAPEVAFWIADYHARQRDYVKAQEAFWNLHRQYPESALADDALFMAGRAAFSRQDYRQAVQLFEQLIKSYTNSSWRCDARMAQGDALTELGQFQDAALVFEAVGREFPDCYLRCEALGRRADCLYTLERYDEAVNGYRAALECAPADDLAFRNQAIYKIGQCFEKAGKLDEAADMYLRVLYETKEWPEPNRPPECFWLGKAGLAAAALREQRQQWREAITIYQRQLELCPQMREVLEERIRRIRVERFIWF
ncbi:MAG: tetratricopeptide repeat protein [Verrucomicrobiae bacterium]|nr:tetratricopeptide repeat protein [Verrucomicrobiae bacterium]